MCIAQNTSFTYRLQNQSWIYYFAKIGLTFFGLVAKIHRQTSKQTNKTVVLVVVVVVVVNK